MAIIAKMASDLPELHPLGLISLQSFDALMATKNNNLDSLPGVARLCAARALASFDFGIKVRMHPITDSQRGGASTLLLRPSNSGIPEVSPATV